MDETLKGSSKNGNPFEAFPTLSSAKVQGDRRERRGFRLGHDRDRRGWRDIRGGRYRSASLRSLTDLLTSPATSLPRPISPPVFRRYLYTSCLRYHHHYLLRHHVRTRAHALFVCCFHSWYVVPKDGKKETLTNLMNFSCRITHRLKAGQRHRRKP